ncbi:bifunctional Ubiquitin-like domain superfamily/Ubiquitin domain/Ubiquitin-like domain [Babesia duncani]|uniref:Bifunctional Ubiquitin-like domain superfamily/Ubiquitin domain/Ubiquitin-like domain n=1 Tax=Babesia duncani TaxID=323732 RepID=A0AAD9PKG7_9APIC|nr:bifunctional Ubiquitin-like domain superfamily/Ubiquitin domain/Ubiquitin-like domain [Babesia duncani]
MAESPTIQLHFRLMTEETITLEVKEDMKILEIKQLLGSRVGCDAESQRFIFKGQLLKNEHTLSSYNISVGSTIHVVNRVAAPNPGAFPRPQAGPASSTPNDMGFMANIGPSMGVFVGTMDSIPVHVPIFGSSNTENAEDPSEFNATTRTETEPTNPQQDNSNVHGQRQHPFMFGRFQFSRVYNPESTDATMQMTQFAQQLMSGIMNTFGATATDGPHAYAHQRREFNGADYAPEEIVALVESAKIGLENVVETLEAHVATSGTSATSATSRANARPFKTGPGAPEATDEAAIASRLPWSTLERLEKFLAAPGPVFNDLDATRTVEKFINRFTEANAQVLQQLHPLNHTGRVDLGACSRMTLTMATSCQLHAELACLGSWLCNGASCNAQATSNAECGDTQHEPQNIRQACEGGTASTCASAPVESSACAENSNVATLNGYRASLMFKRRLSEAGARRCWSDAYMQDNNH